YSPGDSLHSAGCAATLRYGLGFAEASVFTMPAGAGDSTDRVVVTIVEPQDSARVRHRGCRSTPLMQSRTSPRLRRSRVVCRLRSRSVSCGMHAPAPRD